MACGSRGASHAMKYTENVEFAGWANFAFE
jgi:hypothetical protein